MSKNIQLSTATPPYFLVGERKDGDKKLIAESSDLKQLEQLRRDTLKHIEGSGAMSDRSLLIYDSGNKIMK